LTINPEKDGAAYADDHFAELAVRKLKQMAVTAKWEMLIGRPGMLTIATSQQEVGSTPEAIAVPELKPELKILNNG
jgi:hypothetical protein